jgi:hypothetical protein
MTVEVTYIQVQSLYHPQNWEVEGDVASTGIGCKKTRENLIDLCSLNLLPVLYCTS